ncbi:PilZ domain-containing protein [Acidobacteriota bacterium]
MKKDKNASNEEVRAWKDRRDKRFIEENKAIIEWAQYKDPEHGNKIYAFTQDLSIGGTKILTDVSFPIDTVFMITLTLSRSRQIIKVAANVRWVKPVINEDLYEIGLEFIHDFNQSVTGLMKHLFGKEFPQDLALEMNQQEIFDSPIEN